MGQRITLKDYLKFANRHLTKVKWIEFIYNKPYNLFSLKHWSDKDWSFLWVYLLSAWLWPLFPSRGVSLFDAMKADWREIPLSNANFYTYFRSFVTWKRLFTSQKAVDPSSEIGCLALSPAVTFQNVETPSEVPGNTALTVFWLGGNHVMIPLLLSFLLPTLLSRRGLQMCWIFFHRHINHH